MGTEVEVWLRGHSNLTTASSLNARHEPTDAHIFWVIWIGFGRSQKVLNGSTTITGIIRHHCSCLESYALTHCPPKILIYLYLFWFASNEIFSKKTSCVIFFFLCVQTASSLDVLVLASLFNILPLLSLIIHFQKTVTSSRAEKAFDSFWGLPQCLAHSNVHEGTQFIVADVQKFTTWLKPLDVRMLTLTLRCSQSIRCTQREGNNCLWLFQGHKLPIH